MTRALYSLSVAVASGLLAFVTLLYLGPFFESGERWENLALTWMFFGLPAVAAGAACSALVAPLYDRVRGAPRRALLYAANVVVVAALSYVPYFVTIIGP